MQHNDKYQVLGTKVSPEAWQRLNVLANKKNMSVYELIQMVCDTLLRYMDDRHNLSESMERIMAVFEHAEGWSEAFNLADPSVRREVGEATYFLQDSDGKKRGVRCVHVGKPYFGKRTETCNLQDIIDRTLMLITPERYARLHRLKEEMDCGSLLELIDVLIDLHAGDSDVKELREQFEDCNRHEYGKPVLYGQRTKQHKHISIESYEQSLKFKQDDNHDGLT
jgi:hypothetical protein